MRRVWCLGLMFVFSAVTAGADVVTLKSGKQVEGLITGVTDTGVQMTGDSGDFRIRFSQIQDIAASAQDGTDNSAYVAQAAGRLAEVQAREKTRRRPVRKTAPAKRKIMIYMPSASSETQFPADEEEEAGSEQVQHRVEIYTTSWCPQCKKMRNYLNQKGVSYTDYDIEKDMPAHKRFKSFGAEGVPALVVDGQFKGAGFSADWVDAVLAH